MTATPAITAGLPWFKTPFGVDFNSWPRAARRLWEFFRAPEHQGADRFRFRDWEMARLLKVKRRVIQKGLRILEALGVIERGWIWGHDGGREITIKLTLAGPKPKEEKKQAGATPKAKAATACGANGVRPTDTPPEVVAAVQAGLEQRAREDEERLNRPPTQAEQEEVERFLAESRRRRQAAEAKAAAATARATDPQPRRTKDDLLAQIAARQADAAPVPEGRPPDPPS